MLGAPGSGKSTQGQKLADYLGCQWISTGELFRKSNDERIREQIKTEKLIDDDTTFAVLSEALTGVEDAVIDGFPRTRKQAEMALSLGISEVVEIEIPREEILKRLALRGREQDAKEVVEKRLADYSKMRDEVLVALSSAGIEIKQISGMGEVEEVFNRLKEVL